MTVKIWGTRGRSLMTAVFKPVYTNKSDVFLHKPKPSAKARLWTFMIRLGDFEELVMLYGFEVLKSGRLTAATVRAVQQLTPSVHHHNFDFAHTQYTWQRKHWKGAIAFFLLQLWQRNISGVCEQVVHSEDIVCPLIPGSGTGTVYPPHEYLIPGAPYVWSWHDKNGLSTDILGCCALVLAGCAGQCNCAHRYIKSQKHQKEKCTPLNKQKQTKFV